MITCLVPLSKAFDMAPVCLERWKLRSREWMCRKVVLDSFRMELWATFANTAFRSSLNKEAPSLAPPSVRGTLYHQHEKQCICAPQVSLSGPPSWFISAVNYKWLGNYYTSIKPIEIMQPNNQNGQMEMVITTLVFSRLSFNGES